ncbi:aldolase [Candidatus Falkowbacteria bacterium CG10_big_fil_rev_8_21_14_0_10_37_14]|uniref:fructose-bisphosphate aldolase n=1 Tax=Candidatus Falkowbacteria bacterium CG10_big_fil_rev_8_21_14_0_10_37_14 TaxID=1974561 RepID=A0A2M6WSX6_9BACT|nr:aldolase [Candidatus Falkowbacteria bacterium]PIT95884.1 MAG: aldolase [Candidatus Falkowbacteria bacterium CG10_big_fil_rev_8_21_14_0_10_37_14]
MKIHIPASVPYSAKATYLNNWQKATKRSGRLMLFAGDQKIEHLNKDFYGEDIHSDDRNPEHLFRIARKAEVGVFAAQLGLIAAYGKKYRKVPYIIKLNSKTDLIPASLADPISLPLSTVEQVVNLKKHSKLQIVGIGYTIYPGSSREAEMMSTAAQVITEAHAHGLLAVLWIYPRGKAVKDEKDGHLIAGCAGIASSLGADFVKLNYPKGIGKNKPQISEIIQAAGLTGVVFSGGSSTNPKEFLKTLAEQIKAGASGNATGRNIHQKGLEEAVRFAKAISAVSIYKYSAKEAYDVYTGDKKLKPFGWSLLS